VAITFTCSCGKAVQVGDEFAGQAGQCPSCGQTVQIPGGGEFTEQAPPIVPRSTGIKPAPWEELPRLDALPAPDDDVARLMTHAGLLVEPNDDFFVDAPPEIGRLYSAFTTLRKRDKPMAPGSWTMLGIVVFSVVSSLAVLAIRELTGGLQPAGNMIVIAVIGALIGGLFAGVAMWWMRFRHTCTYVGANGIALFQCSGKAERIVRSEVFLFEAAAELRIAQTRQYTNGVYTGTDYAFTWSDERGAVVYTLAGRYRSEAGTPPPGDPFHFALAAENAWTLHLFRAIERILTGNELLFFGLKGGDYLQLGQGLFILVQGGKSVELRSEQIEKMTIGDGVISVWQTGAKAGWFVNKGIHQFMYADLGNARFFLFALEKLLGIRF
jgi:hypothetical protein